MMSGKAADGDTASYTNQWVDDNFKSSTLGEAAITDTEDCGFAARLHTACLRIFKLVSHYTCRVSKYQKEAIQAANVKEELGRFYLWGESFPDGDLDRALEQSDEIRDNVLDLLQGIGETLIRGVLQFLPATQKETHRQDVQDLISLIEQSKIITSNDGPEVIGDCEDTGSECDTEDGDGPDGRGSNFLQDLEFRTLCLMDLVPTLELNLALAGKSRLREVRAAENPFRVSEPAHVYISLVRDKYKEADNSLIERLGEANWQRHVTIRRRMDAMMNQIERELDPFTEKDPVPLFPGPSVFHDSGLGTSSAVSHSSFISSNASSDLTAARVPQMPVEVGLGDPFRCIYCGHTIHNIKNRQDWKMHVFADLRPYICTFSGCKDELVQFKNRSLWADHEFSEHRVEKTWVCPQCYIEFPRPETWVQHVQSSHGIVFSGPRRQIAIATAYKRKEKPVEHEKCFLCNRITGKSRRAFIKHVGQHMEEIALMALPRETEDDSGEASETTNGYPGPLDLNDGNCTVSPFGYSQADMFLGILDRPEKCPVVSCLHHRKGFAHRSDKDRHTLTHYKGTMVCTFCPGSGSAAEKRFNRADVFKRHLTSMHGALQGPLDAHKRSLPSASAKEVLESPFGATNKCSMCSFEFSNAQTFYEHLDNCVLHSVNQEGLGEAVSEAHLSEKAADSTLGDKLNGKVLAVSKPPTDVTSSTPGKPEQQFGEIAGKPRVEKEFTPNSSVPTSSYWSVTDQSRFQNLLPRFGTNWDAIAIAMKNKTPAMVKNYYFRLTELNESASTRDIAHFAHIRNADERSQEQYIVEAASSAENNRKTSPRRPSRPSASVADNKAESDRTTRSRNKTLELNEAREEAMPWEGIEGEHPDTLISIANLASTYWNQGRWKEAEELEVQVMETRKRVLGAEHPDTLTSIANLAHTYYGIDADHPDTIAAKNTLREENIN